MLKLIKSRICLALLACLLVFPMSTFASSQEQDIEARWGKDIQRFEEQDKKEPKPEGQILFVGSSSIRLWDLNKSFGDLETINRGFGGSQISEVNHFFDRIVGKYKPSVIVFYAGDNDIAKGKDAQQVSEDYKLFLDKVEKSVPSAHVIYVPIKPSRSRWDMWGEMSQGNELIRRYCTKNFRWHYADTATPMLELEGPPAVELFADDGLHLSDMGYELWTKIVREKIDVAMKSEALQMAKGVVYEDKNHNGKLDSLDSPLSGIRVSNGELIVATDSEGKYEIPVSDDDIVFVIKPRGYRTPVSRDQLPEFYYIHKPNGSPISKFPGVEPTGPLPESIDFPLYPQKEPDQFRAVFFGDPQPRNQKEVDFVIRDVVEELVGTDAAFGVTLGDIMFDDLSLFKSQNQGIALLGIPWYNVIGNHDVNRDAPTDELSDETFESHYGPNYYSFDYGPTHFIVLDDIQHMVNAETGQVGYQGGLGEEQIHFIREDLSSIPDDQLVVLMMHIPLPGVVDRHSLYRLIERRPFCISISGHTHHHEHRFIDENDDWKGKEPHHHIINVTVSGSWWGGHPDERGIPHTMMADGAPNGYSFITFDGSDYEVDFKAAGRPADYQMRIISPIEVTGDEVATTTVYANVFNGSSKSTVELRWEHQNHWTPMTYSLEKDPEYIKLAEEENGAAEKTWTDLPNAKPSPHLWKATLSSPGEPGTYMLVIRETDYRGRTTTSKRAIRVR